MEIRPGARDALTMLADRCRHAAQVGATWKPLTDEPTVVVGAGGSHPAADFIARLLRERGGVARSAYPLDAEGGERHLIAVSYSGTTPDLAEAIRRFRLGGGDTVTLLTGADDPALDADTVRCHRSATTHPQEAGLPERGFISFAATVAPCAAEAAAHRVRGVTEALDDRSVSVVVHTPDDSSTSLKEALGARRLDVIGSGWAWPTALDLESKWTEAANGPLVVHEAKNFSHGRFLSVLDSSATTVVVLIAGEASPYEQSLLATLRHHQVVVVMQSALSGPVGGLALLHAAQRLAVLAGEGRGVDISRPRIPRDGVALHHWDWMAG